MPYARRRSDAPDRPPDLAGLAAQTADRGLRADELLARAGALLDAAEAGAPLPEWLGGGRLTLLLHGLRQLGASQAMTGEQLRRLSLEGLLNDMERGALEAGGFRQGAAAVAAGRHRHRRDRKPSAGQLSLIPGGKWKAPAALSGPLAAKIALGAAAASVVVAAPAFVTHTSGQPVPAALHRSSSLPVLSPADAIPLASPLQRPAYVPRHAKPSPDANTATLAPSPPVVAAPPQEPSAAPSAVAYGTLDVQTAVCAIGLSGRCQVTFWAVGGPVAWQASVPDPALSVDQSEGTLAAGEPVTITVSVQAGSLAGAGSITISDGDGNATQVPVSWVALLPAL